MARCVECGAQVPDDADLIVGYRVKRTEDGQIVEGSHETIGVFHAACWAAYKAAHPDVVVEGADDVGHAS